MTEGNAKKTGARRYNFKEKVLYLPAKPLKLTIMEKKDHLLYALHHSAKRHQQLTNCHAISDSYDDHVDADGFDEDDDHDR